MTAAPPVPAYRFVNLSVAGLRARLSEALDLYVTAMRYPKSTTEQRAPMWLTHMLREGWRCVAAIDNNDRLLGICYGYQGAPGQWWHEQVRRGLLITSGTAAVEAWTRDYFELTELHVRPDAQGHGIGEGLLRLLLDGVPARGDAAVHSGGSDPGVAALPPGRVRRRAAGLPVRGRPAPLRGARAHAAAGPARGAARDRHGPLTHRGQISASRSRIVPRPIEPISSACWWNALRSKPAPLRCLASSRAASQSRSPSL